MKWILILGVVLASLEISTTIEVRLVNGKHNYEGRIEVKYKGTWKAVCDHGWNRKAARVVCRMLGFPDVLRFTKGRHAYGNGDGRFWLDDVECTGSEDSIDKCSHRPWGRNNCLKYNQAGVVCRMHPEDVIIEPKPSNASGNVSKIEVKLVGPVVDDYISGGFVQVKHEGKWGYICSTESSRANLNVLCGQLGFPHFEVADVVEDVALEEEDPLFWLNKLQCDGWESTIVSCRHGGWIPHHCESNSALRIKCRRRKITKPLDVRLRSGALVSEGRVEVQYQQFWGSICDDHWTLKEANVVCRSLGYGSAAMAAKNAYYGRGTGRVMLDDVYCKGTERGIRACQRSRWHKTDCDHYEDASVRCNVPTLQGHEVRIRGGANPFEGRVEVFNNGTWGTVCADEWGIEEAMTVCRQLNLGYASDAVTQGNYSVTDLEMIMSGVKCRVDEISIYNCQHDDWTMANCSSKKPAGVICVNALPDLVLDTDRLKYQMEMNLIPLWALRCAMEENCLSSSAAVQMRYSEHYRRRLLRFTVKVENRGLDHFRPKEDKSTWQWHSCHKHYHSMEMFSSYDLVRQESGEKVAQGHKASFCLEDTKCDPGFEQVWNCTDRGDQGISPGCFDIYNYNIDCQWVDVTDFVHGGFYLRVHLNPGNQVAESDFRNNVAKCSVYDYGSYVITNRCWIEDCESGLDTHGGNSGGNCCVFPFLFNGKLHHDCTTAGYSRKWCSTTYDFSKDRKWGLCFD